MKVKFEIWNKYQSNLNCIIYILASSFIIFIIIIIIIIIWVLLTGALFKEVLIQLKWKIKIAIKKKKI